MAQNEAILAGAIAMTLAINFLVLNSLLLHHLSLKLLYNIPKTTIVFLRKTIRK